MRTLPFILLWLTAAVLARDVSTPTPAPAAEPGQPFPEPGKAWENSLGMKFVPVPGTRVLFSIWDTRVRDYMAFLADKKTKVEGAATLPVGIPAGSIIDEARKLSESGISGLKLPPRSLPDEIKAEAAQSQNARHPLYPIAQVTWEDASDFCGWLTEKEQREGKLDKNQGYRLPTDQEWSQAVGLPEESGSTPKEKSGRIKDVYPWGREWPPPRRSGNYADQSSKDVQAQMDAILADLKLHGAETKFGALTPVGSFTPNRYGLYDMGGNVWQWCNDWYDETQKTRVLRGPSALVTGAAFLISSARIGDFPGNMDQHTGFRCVISFDSSAPKAPLPKIVADPRVEPTKQPIFRIEAEMHNGAIRHISVDTAGRLALTVSSDKTARLWELSSGRLLRVLRPPIGEGTEGELAAGALSPDGALAAVGGWTGFQWDLTSSIYVFDTATGRLARRLSALPATAHDLAFSATGRFLAGTLGSGKGLRVWETETGQEVGRDTDYGEEVSASVSWHGEDRLVTTCFDGKLRLYQLAADAGRSSLTLLKKSAVRGGSKFPRSAQFSPDGRFIAVGFDFGVSRHSAAGSRSADKIDYSKSVTVVDGSDLSFRFAPSTAGLKSGSLSDVVWDDDGASLAAGGSLELARGDVRALIRRWADGGRGRPSDIVTAPHAVIMDLKALPGGRILFATSTPAWGVLGTSGPPRQLGGPPVADYSDIPEGLRLRLSGDGAIVGFGYERFGKAPARFTITGRELTLLDNARAASDLSAPLLAGLKISDWKGFAPKNNGQPLPLEDNEASTSLAIAKNARSFLIGTNFNLRCFGAWGAADSWMGKIAPPVDLWHAPAPGPVWAVNLADSDRLAVAAYGDGTIRWHRADNGRELLAFFPHNDRKRWVVWATEYQSAGMLGIALEKSPAGKVIIKELVSGGPAQGAALEAGDELTGIEGETVTEVDRSIELIRSHPPGSPLRISLQRGSTPIQKTVILGGTSAPGPGGTLAAGPDGSLGPGLAKAVYYDCSPGAEDLIGWQVNRGKDQAADFFPASRFRNVFYRPDVISRVLRAGDVGEALRQADRERGLPETQTQGIAEVVNRLSPPVVELEVGGVFGKVTLPAEAAEVSIRYRVRQTGAEPPTKVTVRFNGRLLDLPAPLPKPGDVAEIVAPIPRGMVGELSVLAEHRLAVSEAAVLRIEREGPAHPRQPDLYVISVGVSKLKSNEGNPIRKAGDSFLPDLERASDDARQIGKTFEAQNGKLYHRVILQTLADREATAPALREALRSVAKQAGPEDVAIFFFAGHGVVDPKAGFYLATHEAELKDPAATALTGKELSTLLEGIKARTVVALDTCHSGGAFGGARLAKVITNPNDLTGLVNELSSAEQGTVVMSSSAASQESLEDPEKGGLFTVALCEGLESRGGAAANGGDPGGATVDCAGLRDWLTKRVPELVAALFKGERDAPQQTPVCVIPKGVPDFPIATKR